MSRIIRSIAVASIVGVTSLSVIGTANAAKKPTTKCHVSKGGKKVWTTKCSKVGKNGKNGVNGKNGTDGKQGAKGDTGSMGPQGERGANGANGANGLNGRDGVRWERIVGTCGTGIGEVMVIDNALKIGGLDSQGAYGQFKMLVENLRLNDVTKLSFRVKLPVTTGSAYLKLKLEGNRFIVFQPGAQGAETTEWTTYNVAAASSKLRDNNDSGTTPTFSLAQLQATHGNLAVKSLEITGGCAGSAIPGAVLVDDVTINDTIISFN